MMMVTMLNRAIVSHGPGVTHWGRLHSVCQDLTMSAAATILRLRCVQIWNPKHADALLNRHIYVDWDSSCIK